MLNGGITDDVIVVTPAAIDFSTVAPVVAIDPNNESPDCIAIISTNRGGALQFVQYLLKLGHRRIGFINERSELVSAYRRLQGYKDALVVAGIPIDEHLIEMGDYTTETAITCTHRYLGLENPPAAIFVANDQTAMGVYQAVREAGLRIPEDLSVIGSDNFRESVDLVPQLITIDQFISKMGTLAVEMIVKLINGEKLEKIYAKS